MTMPLTARFSRHSIVLLFASFWVSLAFPFPAVSGVPEILTVGTLASEVLEVRIPDTMQFVQVTEGTPVPEKSLVRCLDHFGFETQELPILSLPASRSLEFFPGSLAEVSSSRVRFLRGKFRLIVPEGSKAPLLVGGEAVCEMEPGEAYVEADPKGTFLFALKRGSGWVKGRELKVVLLEAGKQVEVGADGTPGKPGEFDSRWKSFSTQLVQGRGFTSGGEADEPITILDEGFASGTIIMTGDDIASGPLASGTRASVPASFPGFISPEVASGAGNPASGIVFLDDFQSPSTASPDSLLQKPAERP